MADVDITNQIKRIEFLKCALLGDVSALFESMRVPGRSQDEHLTALVTHTYLLAERLGLDYASLDASVIQSLKRKWAADTGADSNALLTHWAKKAEQEGEAHHENNFIRGR
jgi:hypothetical protein